MSYDDEFDRLSQEIIRLVESFGVEVREVSDDGRQMTATVDRVPQSAAQAVRQKWGDSVRLVKGDVTFTPQPR